MPCRAISASSVVTGTRIVLVQRWPSQPGAPSAASMKHREAVETVGLSILSFSSIVPSLRADRDRLDGDGAVAAVEQLERLDQRRLRLDRDHPRAEPAERRDAVADMRADVEHEIAALDEAADRAGPSRRGARRAVIDAQRADDAAQRSATFRAASGRVSQRGDDSIAGSASAAQLGAAARSLPAGGRGRSASARGRRAGDAVTTASGIDSAGRRR